jgi:hypothetical protein
LNTTTQLFVLQIWTNISCKSYYAFSYKFSFLGDVHILYL